MQSLLANLRISEILYAPEGGSEYEFIEVRNIGSDTRTIRPGDRIAQLIPMAIYADGIQWEYSKQLDDTARGANGFGSTGR